MQKGGNEKAGGHSGMTRVPFVTVLERRKCYTAGTSIAQNAETLLIIHNRLLGKFEYDQVKRG